MSLSSMRVNGPRHAFAYEDITVDATAGGKGVTAATAFPVKLAGSGVQQVALDFGAEEATFSVEVDTVRYTLDGTAPTATLGHLLGLGDILTVVGRDNLKRLRFIRVTTNATIRATYFRD